ncbi:MAG: hypothetical protein MK226_08915 [Saprospiraceae bacterium]|nr:hypothetical protein [Saprospiraceae bacterium]
MQQQKHKIGIVGWGSISALGEDRASIWERYQQQEQYLSFSTEKNVWEGRLSAKSQQSIAQFRANKLYASLDPTVLMAMLAAKQAVEQSQWGVVDDIGINIGSSRGATQLWEKYFQQFSDNKVLSPLASPTTTSGNISSWVAHHLGSGGLALEHSITCSTALHALLNGMTWLESGRASRFIIGGSEAALTPFTLSQMQSLRIYSRANPSEVYPCKSLHLGKVENTMVLGEGAACFCMENNPSNPIAWIAGVGYAREQVRNATSISAKGMGFQQSMQMALAEAELDRVDVVLCHAPGTIKGDQSEVNAINAIWPNEVPLITSNKWKIGHTFGASGALSLELALLMLEHQCFISTPFEKVEANQKIQNILVNAMGFGGNAVSVILSVPSR